MVKWKSLKYLTCLSMIGLLAFVQVWLVHHLTDEHHHHGHEFEEQVGHSHHGTDFAAHHHPIPLDEDDSSRDHKPHSSQEHKLSPVYLKKSSFTVLPLAVVSVVLAEPPLVTTFETPWPADDPPPDSITCATHSPRGPPLLIVIS